MSVRDEVHPIDLVDRVRQKIAFLSDIDDRTATIDGDQGLYWIFQDMNNQLKEAVKRLEERTVCNGCNGQPKEEL